MCLYNDYYAAVKFAHKRKHRTIVAYKVVWRPAGRSQLYSPFRQNFQWKMGYNISNRQDRKLTAEYYLTEGIHVYATRLQAQRMIDCNPGYDYVVLPVFCRIKDLIGVETTGNKHVEYLFWQVYVSPTAYAKALKK